MRRVFVASMLVILMMVSVGTYSFQSIDGFEDTDVLIGGGEESATDGRQSSHAEWTMDTVMFASNECNYSQPNSGTGVLYPSHYLVGGCNVGQLIPDFSAYHYNFPSTKFPNSGSNYQSHWANGPCGVLDQSGTMTGTGWSSDQQGIGGDFSDCFSDFELDAQGNMYVVGTYVAERMVFPVENGADIVLNNSGGEWKCSMNSADSLISPDDKTDWNCSVDTFVAKMDSNGVWQWAKRVDSRGDDGAVRLALNAQGDVYIGGYVSAEAAHAVWYSGGGSATSTSATFGQYTLDTGSPINGNINFWVGYVAKLSTNGVWQWAKAIESWNNEMSNVYDVAVDPRAPENVYFVGVVGQCDAAGVEMNGDDPAWQGCSTEENSVVGKITENPGIGNPVIDWMNFEGPYVEFQEIVRNADGFVISGHVAPTGPSQHNLGVTSVQVEDSFITRIDASGNYDWTNSCQNGRFYGIASSANNIAVEMVPGTECSNLNNGFHGFQIGMLDSVGNWIWVVGDSFDPANTPSSLANWVDDWVGNGNLEFDENGDLVSVRLFQKLMKIGGSNILPSHHIHIDPNMVGSQGYTGAEYYGHDLHFARFDATTGGMVWSYVEDLPDPCVVNCNGVAEFFGYPMGYTIGAPANLWDIEVKDVWNIRVSGPIVGHDGFGDIQLHDGLPDTDIPYSGTDIGYPRNDYSGDYGDSGVFFADFVGCRKLVTLDPVDGQLDDQESTVMARSASNGWDGSTSWDNVSLQINPERYVCADEPVPIVLGCTDPGALNYDPLATHDDGSCLYPTPPLDDCCVHYDGIVNLTGVEKLHIMEITAPVSAGSSQGPSAGFYHIEYDIAQETMPGGILVNDIPDSQQMLLSGAMGVGLSNSCELLTAARECYDFYLSDSQGNLDPYGNHLAIRLYSNSQMGGNIDAIWLEYTNGDVAYASVVTHYDPGVFQTYVGGQSLEALGAVSNDPSVVPISNPSGYTYMGGGPGGDFTTLVVCFDVLVDPEYRSGVVEGNEVSRDEEVATGLDITGAGDTADIVVIGGVGIIAGMGLSSLLAGRKD